MQACDLATSVLNTLWWGGGGGPIWIVESFTSSSLQMSSSGAHQGEERNQTQQGMFDN